MTPQTTIVHEQFPKWLLLALPNASAEIVEKRRNALSELIPAATDVEPEVVVDFVRLMFELPASGTAAEATLRQACIGHDPQFANGAARHELAILAGTVIMGLINHRSSAANAAILAISCASARGARNADHLAPFVSLARDARRRNALAAVRESVLPAMPDGLLTVADTEASSGGTATVNSLAAYVKRVIADSERILGQFREELDATWWVVGEYSRDLDVPLRQMPAVQAPVVLAKELADMTRSDVGPLAAKSVLHRVLKLPKKVPASFTIAEAIEKLEAQWRAGWVRSVVGSAKVDGVTPLLAAAARYEELGGKTAWREAFEQSCRLPATAVFAALDLATQVYDESLLIRLVNGQPQPAS